MISFSKKNKLFALIPLLVILLGFTSYNGDLPNVKVKDLKGKSKVFNELFSTTSDTVTIVSFWATWCAPCVRELEALNEVLPSWQKETKVKLIAISTDDARTLSKVKPFVAGMDWKFNIYTDVNSDLKRALNISNVPFTLLIKNGKIIYKKDGYLPGSESDLLKKIKASN
jgi:cytochrome c biogenesis protein CcmG, thiol:disulfide interchange protein DsbE